MTDGSEPTDPRSPGVLILADEGDRLVAGADVGRYRILERLGAGGMGEVYRANDPRLGRDVAIKVVRPGRGDPRAHQRLLGEAQAMAKLAHPNVVAIYEVGELGAEVFIAMEYVEGTTLRAWLGERKRSWREVLAAYVAAGRGLAAAHRAQVVHRDVKPDNVLVGADRRVRVTDFGLAEGPGTESDGGPEGTPAYMAPELARDGGASTLSDQYSFCMALWEGLFGERFAPGTKPHGDVPAWVTRAVERGLSESPDARFPSMDALLARLEADPGAVRRRIAWLAGGAAAATLAVLAAMRVSAPEAACQGAERKLAGVWDDAVKAKVRTRFLAGDRPYATGAYERVARSLDTYARAWVGMHTEVCRASAVRGDQSQSLLDLRMGCLDRRAVALGALATVFASEADTAERADDAVARLEPLAECADAHALTQAYPPPRSPAMRVQVASLTPAIAAAVALSRAGAYAQANQKLVALAAEARRAGYPPLLAEALLELGNSQILMHDGVGADASLREAIRVAAETNAHRLEAEAWTKLMLAQWYLGRPGTALELRVAAEAAIARAGGDPDLQARMLSVVGTALREQGKWEEARQALEQSLALDEQVGKDEHRVAGTMKTLSVVLLDEGRLDEAAKLLERTQALYEKTLGPDHPYLAGTFLNSGLVYDRMGDYAAARRAFERALASFEKNLGPEHAQVARALTNLSFVAVHQRRFVDAETLARRALAMKEKALGSEHLLLASTLADLARALHGQGRAAEARPVAERALALREKLQGPKHPDVADALITLAAIDRHQHRLDEAARAAARAQAILADANAPDSREVLTECIEIELARRRPAQALVLLERAAAVRGSDPVDGAELDSLHARALRDAGIKSGAARQSRPIAPR